MRAGAAADPDRDRPAVATATAALAARPGGYPAVPASAAAVLQTTAAVAADQPGAPPWTGFRYTNQSRR